jgi:hypothetical protein
MTYDFFIHSKDELIQAVQTFGIVPYFSNPIPGFSLEERCDPRVLWSDTGDNSWAWKGPVIQSARCAYGKFFFKKAAYVSLDVFLDLANYRRDGYDFDARYDEGLASRRENDLYTLLAANAPILSRRLKELGGYGKNRRKDQLAGFSCGKNKVLHLKTHGTYLLCRNFLKKSIANRRYFTRGIFG